MRRAHSEVDDVYLELLPASGGEQVQRPLSTSDVQRDAGPRSIGQVAPNRLQGVRRAPHIVDEFAGCASGTELDLRRPAGVPADVLLDHLVSGRSE
jgi:hypothetical protein